jgi:hypothetical protein
MPLRFFTASALLTLLAVPALAQSTDRPGHAHSAGAQFVEFGPTTFDVGPKGAGTLVFERRVPAKFTRLFSIKKSFRSATIESAKDHALK